MASFASLASAPAFAQPADAGGLVQERAPDPLAAGRDHQAGKAKLLAGDVGGAVDLLRSAHALDPRAAHIANDLGFALAKLGARREAEIHYRRALALDERRWLAYVNLLELHAESPERWQRRDEVLALADRALLALREDPGRQSVTVAAAGFERSLGRLAEARRRLEQLPTVGLTPQLRKRVNDTLRAIDEDERTLELADWPEPALGREDAATLVKAEAHLQSGHAAVAVDLAGALLVRHPGASGARFLRARALQALAKYDPAIHELLLLLQLRPSHAGAWRLLGTILADHGGTLQARRADEALRKALALEPSWHDLRETRRKLAASLDSSGEVRSTVRPSQSPSPRAQALLVEAQRWIAHDVPSMASTVLMQALADSPGFVEAAVSLYSIGGGVLPGTVQALWNDGDGLGRLAAELVKVRNDEQTLALANRWLDRAVQLGAAEARFERAVLRAADGETARALIDLAAYVGSGVEPPRLAEARALRSSLEPALRDRSAVGWARRQLLAGRADEAARELGGSCRPDLTADALIELGRIAEYEERTADALACHRRAIAAASKRNGGEGQTALDRIARIAAGLPGAEARRLAPTLGPELEAARRAGIPAAEWALARLAAAGERWEDAIASGERFLRAAPPDDPLRRVASEAMQSMRAEALARDAAQAGRLRLALLLAGATLLLAVTIAVSRRLRGRSVAGALARVPDLYPEVARVTAEIRHDVLKHRASALGMLARPDAPALEVARALLEPSPTSAAVTAAYERLRRAAAAAGISLQPLAREPVFGPLHQALTRAEALLAGKAPGAAALRELGELDQELREQHGPALTALLAMGPRTRLDPAAVAAWLPVARDRERLAGAAVTPGLHLAALDVDLPITASALQTIVANLVRNAVAAARTAAEPRVLVRVEEGQDAAGRRLVTFLVADSAPGTVALDDIEQRDGERGLGIVRDLVRRWGGHLVVRREQPPFAKAIGAAFPVQPRPPEGEAPRVD